MATLQTDDLGSPVPQYLNEAGNEYEYHRGANGGTNVNVISNADNVAHGAADAGDPTKIGFAAADPAAMPADVDAGDRANGVSDLKGRQIVTMDEVIQTPGSAVPARAVQVGGSDGTDTRALKTDPAGQLLTGNASELITLHAAGAETASGVGTPVTGLGKYKSVEVLLDVTAAATEVGDTIDVYLYGSLDGTAWVNVAHFTQVLGNGGAKKFIAQINAVGAPSTVVDVTSDLSAGDIRHGFLGDRLRVEWAITDSGTSNASFDFAVTAMPKA